MHLTHHKIHVCRSYLLYKWWKVLWLATRPTTLRWHYQAGEGAKPKKILCSLHCFTYSRSSPDNLVWRDCNESKVPTPAGPWSKLFELLGGARWRTCHWWQETYLGNSTHTFASAFVSLPWKPGWCLRARGIWWCPASHQHPPRVWWWWWAVTCCHNKGLCIFILSWAPFFTAFFVLMTLMLLKSQESSKDLLPYASFSTLVLWCLGNKALTWGFSSLSADPKPGSAQKRVNFAGW